MDASEGAIAETFLDDLGYLSRGADAGRALEIIRKDPDLVKRYLVRINDAFSACKEVPPGSHNAAGSVSSARKCLENTKKLRQILISKDKYNDLVVEAYELSIEICLFLLDREELFRSLSFCVTQVYPNISDDVKCPNKARITGYWLANCFSNVICRNGELQALNGSLKREVNEFYYNLSLVAPDVRENLHVGQLVQLVSLISSGVLDYYGLYEFLRSSDPNITTILASSIPVLRRHIIRILKSSFYVLPRDTLMRYLLFWPDDFKEFEEWVRRELKDNCPGSKMLTLRQRKMRS